MHLPKPIDLPSQYQDTQEYKPVAQAPSMAQKTLDAAKILLARQLRGEDVPVEEELPMNAQSRVPADSSLGQLIREEVEAANRSWLTRLVQGVSDYLGGEEHDEFSISSAQENPSRWRYTPPQDERAKRNPQAKKYSVLSPYTQPARTERSRSNRAGDAVTGSDAQSRTRPSSRYLEAQQQDPNKFAQFVFGDKDHAYLAGGHGLWQAKLQAVSTPAASGSSSGEGKAEIKAVINQLAKDTITLNGQANTASPLTGPIAHLTTYGANNRVAVGLADAKDAKEASSSLKLFAATDDAATTFVTNKLAGEDIDAAAKFYDATQELDAGDTKPAANSINQPILAVAASHQDDRFFVAVADGGTTDRALYKRPDEKDDPVRKAMTDGMAIIKKVDGTDLAAGLENVPPKLTPQDSPPNPIDANERYVQAVVNSVNKSIFLSDLNADEKDIHEKYSEQVFRDAINLRKGGLIDLAIAAEGNALAPVDVLKDIENVDGIKNLAAAAADFPVKEDADKGVLAAAIQVGLGSGIRELLQEVLGKKELFKPEKSLKPWVSLDSRKVVDATSGDANPHDLNLYVADQDGTARGISVAKIDGNALVTKDATPAFFANPGKIITKAMYEGIDFKEKDALEKDFGKLEQVGIPCAVYSAADAYPATRAMISDKVDMCWDDELKRLFVGFGDIALGDDAGYLTNGSGGVCSIMVGQEKKINAAQPNGLYFQPAIANFCSLQFQDILNPDAALAKDFKKANPTDYIAGFYQKHNPDKLANPLPGDDLHASAKKLRVMHTSTGKDYLIFNGGVAPQSNFKSLNSKMYALPLVGTYSDDLKLIEHAGLIAAAERFNADPQDFYKKGLKDIKFTDPVGVVDAADNATGTLNLLHAAVQGYVKTELTDLKDTNGKDAAKALVDKVVSDYPQVQAGLATVALQSSWVKDAGGTPGVKEAASNAFKIVTQNYDFAAEPEKIQQSQLLERIEQAGIDLAVPAGADDRAKTQAPAYDVARYIVEDKIKAAIAKDDVNDIWDIVKAVHAVRFGQPADNLDVENAKINALDAGGIAGGVAAVEGSLGLALNKIYNGDKHKHKLLPAVQTMHTDATYPAFDYVRVGADPKRLSFDTSALVQDVQVVGDTVYVALGNARDASHTGESGVFASTAIFHSNGFIRAWTPWRRVMGHADPVAGVALDPTSSRYWYTTTKDVSSIADASLPETDSLDTLRVTAWGRGHVAAATGAGDAAATTDARLSTVLEKVFGDIGGVYGLYSFGPETQGFKERKVSDIDVANRHEQFSMAVATGNGRVALIKTGKFDPAAGVFKSTTAFNTTGNDRNVFVFDESTKNYGGKGLSNLGIITCAEVSRLPLDVVADPVNPQNRNGFLFVGGTEGVAVLTRWFNGKGWDTSVNGGLADLLPGSQRDDFPAGDGWRWMQILTKDGTNPFKDVRKLVSDGSRYLYVMTAKEIWRLDMMATPGAGGGGVPAARTAKEYGIFRRPQLAPAAPKRPDIEYAIRIEKDDALYKVADDTAKNTVGNDVFVDHDGAQFLDMLVGYRVHEDIKMPANNKTQLVVATNTGLFYNAIDKFTDEPATVKGNLAANTWKQVETYAKSDAGADVNKELATAAMRLELRSSQPGDKLKVATDAANKAKMYADGNLEVTALSEDRQALCVYRFNLSAERWDDPANIIITPFKEPYHDGGDKQKTTPYFYKVGTFNPGDQDKIEFGGALDYFVRTGHVTGSTHGFADSVWMMPQPALFTRDQSTGNFEDIDLGLDLTLPLYLGNIHIDPATGAEMVAGEFGVRVND